MATISKNTEKLLNNIAEELDITPKLFAEAEKRYLAVGEFLKGFDIDKLLESSVDNAPESVEAEIYTQGSFALGTAVRPWRSDSEQDFDIDLVFQINIPKGTKSPAALKQTIGDKLKSSPNYSEMIDSKEGKRCWTLNYADTDGYQFHMDILPAYFDPNNKDTVSRRKSKTIDITHKNDANSYDWLSSNPKGYADWFHEINIKASKLITASERLITKDRSLETTITDIPNQSRKTPLQKTIQILKRHRDIRFSGHKNENYKPISIILTTLATRAYNNELSLVEALTNIVNKLIGYKVFLEYAQQNDTSTNIENIIRRDFEGNWIIENPVCNEENFADKWHLENDKRAKVFFEWLGMLKSDMDALLNVDINQDKLELLATESFGKRVAKAALNDVNMASNNNLQITTALGSHEIITPPKPWSR